MQLRPGTAVFTTGGVGQLVVDLQQVTFSTPDAIVALCCKIGKVAAAVQVEVLAPLSANAANYLSRVHFPLMLDSLGVRHNFRPVNEWDQGAALVELTRFTGHESVAALANSVYAFAQPYDPAAAAALHTAVCEAGENVGFHSGVDHGYLLAQYFPKMRQFEFALGDGGQGYFQSLSKIGATGPQDALRMAATTGISVTGDPNRGRGIAQICEGLVRLGGSLIISTDDHARLYADRWPDGAPLPVNGKITGSLMRGRIKY